ncbi:hypothetical protein FRX31_004036 [Thalictrum thalictroides]|uniref:Uncharacterized protein n=1 Tax=Thalictrum thalictroides TaxID=46969 RepID=A0A7J6XBN5_THATH|nr:hypothetical protein FRX31_004036 [Thalictrum thalictroides]
MDRKKSSKKQLQFHMNMMARSTMMAAIKMMARLKKMARRRLRIHLKMARMMAYEDDTCEVIARAVEDLMFDRLTDGKANEVIKVLNSSKVTSKRCKGVESNTDQS